MSEYPSNNHSRTPQTTQSLLESVREKGTLKNQTVIRRTGDIVVRTAHRESPSHVGNKNHRPFINRSHISPQKRPGDTSRTELGLSDVWSAQQHLRPTEDILDRPIPETPPQEPTTSTEQQEQVDETAPESISTSQKFIESFRRWFRKHQ